MRISVMKGTEGFTPMAHMFCVMLNGEELLKAVMVADEEKGYAFCYELDDQGQPMPTIDKRSFRTIRYNGVIKIGFNPHYEVLLLEEDKGLTPEQFLKKYSRQQDAANLRSRKLH